MRTAGGRNGIRASIIVTAVAVFSIGRAAAVPILALSGTVSESYNDNVGLVPQGAGPEAAWITALTPNIDVNDQGRRVQFNLNYQPNLLIFAGNTQFTTVQQNLVSAGQVELLKDTFFVKEQAAITPQFINGFGALGATTYTTNSNLQTIEDYQLSALLRHHFGDITDAETIFSYGQFIASGDVLAPLQNEELRQTFTSGTYFGPLGWTLTADATRDRVGTISGESTPSGILKDDLARADFKYAILRGLALTASGGYEELSFPEQSSVQSLVSSLRGPTWNAGFAYTPDPRVSFDATYGIRYGEPDYEVDAKYNGGLTIATLTYSETIETTSMLLLSGLGGLGFLNGLPISTITGLPFTGNSSFGVIPGLPSSPTNSPFLARILNASLQRTLERNTFTANALYGTERFGAPTTTVTGSSLSGNVNINASSALTETFYTASLSWARNLSPELTSNLSPSYYRANFFGSSAYEGTYALLGSLSYALGARSALTFQLSISRQQFNGSSNNINNDSAMVAYTRRF